MVLPTVQSRRHARQDSSGFKPARDFQVFAKQKFRKQNKGICAIQKFSRPPLALSRRAKMREICHKLFQECSRILISITQKSWIKSLEFFPDTTIGFGTLGTARMIIRLSILTLLPLGREQVARWSGATDQDSL